VVLGVVCVRFCCDGKYFCMRLYQIVEATLGDVANRVPVWLEKYKKAGLHQSQIEEIVKADPTRGKYTEWLIIQYISDRASFPQDAEQLRGLLEIFDKKKSKLEQKDINQYTPFQLREVLSLDFDLTKSERKAARRGMLNIPASAELALSEGDFDVVVVVNRPKDETKPNYVYLDKAGKYVVDDDAVKAATLLSSGTKWCTANESSASRYLKDGPLYFIYKGGVRFALVHLKSKQIKNVDNRDLLGSDLYDVLKLLEPLTNIVADHYPTFILQAAEQRFKDAMSGRSWLSKKDVADARAEARVLEVEPYLFNDMYAANEYAEKVLGTRWPEYEDFLLKSFADALRSYISSIDSENVFMYAHMGNDEKQKLYEVTKSLGVYANHMKHVDGMGWLDAEKLIYDAISSGSSNPWFGAVLLYLPLRYIEVGGRPRGTRWPEYEKLLLQAAGDRSFASDNKQLSSAFVISTLAYYMANYAIVAVNDRWPEAEPFLLAEPLWAIHYAEYALKERWVEAEKEFNKRYGDKNTLVKLQYSDKFKIKPEDFGQDLS
jgi:hypothetical protein